MSPSATPTDAPAPVQPWQAFHLFYHSDRDRLARDVVAPLCGHLLSGGLAESVFFLRYSLGGPHLRFRALAAEGQRDEIRKETEARAAAFFRSHPSSQSVDREDIARENAAVAAAAPLESDLRVYPDNHFAVMDFAPEVERYGGRELLSHSLEMFEASSLSVLELLLELEGASRPSQIAHFLRFLFCQALGVSASFDDIEGWLGYGDFFWPRMPSIEAAADRAFDQQPAVLSGLVEAEFREPSFPFILTASRRLAAAVGTAPREVQRRILASQFHMTANRLGIKNREEIYLCRLMQRAWAEASVRLDADAPPRVERDVAEWRRDAVQRLSSPGRTEQGP
ncbi:MAG: lantibiotic dehydratase C-terminal domain-containing protein [Acidobacteriota bacterium]